MPILSAALRLRLFSAIATLISDAFNRTTSTNLGTSDTGQAWTALRGTWTANGSQATSADAASSYPIASISQSANTTVSATVTGGTGVAYWITDSGSWWASFPTYTTSTSSQSTCTGTSPNCYGAGCTPSNCCSGVYYQNVSISSWSNCDGYAGSSVTGFTCSYLLSGSNAANTFCSWNPGSFSGYSCTDTIAGQCGTLQNTSVTNYETKFTTIKSVANTVTTENTTLVATSTSSYNTMNSLSVQTTGTTITGKAYSGSNLTSQLSSNIVITPTTPTTGSGVGIIKAPTTNNQGSTIDNFQASV